MRPAPLFYVTFLCTNLPPVLKELQMDGGSQARRTVMVDRSDLIHKANELRQSAELEANEDILRGLMRTADHYAHLAESKAQSEAHPPSAASLGEVFIKGS